jgi:hypothetical protein
MIATNSLARSLRVALLFVGLAPTTSTPGLSDTIINNGFCNIIIQGNNNSGTYFNFCHGIIQGNETPFDPPQLWLGMDLAAVMSVLGARSPYVTTENGRTVVMASGTLFGLSGNARYGFNASKKLSWMSVETQCSEMKRDYTLRQRPPDLHPSWEQWGNSPDVRLSYDKTTSCAKILDLLDTLPKLFGQAASDRHGNEFGAPSQSQICSGITEGPAQSCTNAGANRLTFIQDFVGTDRVTGIGLEIRQLNMHGDVQTGSNTPEIRRREFAGIVSVWGPDGRPSIDGDFKGHYWQFLRPGDIR